jgi:hypothetical protein
MNENLKELITAVGVLAEMMRLFREELLKNGFSRSETLYLVSAFMQAQLKNNNNNKQEEI